jgi:hypothetical protein
MGNVLWDHLATLDALVYGLAAFLMISITIVALDPEEFQVGPIRYKAKRDRRSSPAARRAAQRRMIWSFGVAMLLLVATAAYAAFAKTNASTATPADKNASLLVVYALSLGSGRSA